MQKRNIIQGFAEHKDLSAEFKTSQFADFWLAMEFPDAKFYGMTSFDDLLHFKIA